MKNFDTIAAIATPPGSGGVGIVRVSGADLDTIKTGILDTEPLPRQARLACFKDKNGNTIDQGLVLYFPGPNSFTGEDVMELQGHGGQVVMQLLLDRVIELGARQARAGEFSERAFLNGKLDLVQTEAIADLISASSAQSVRAAQRSLSGVFSRRVNQILAELTAIRVFVEAAIDFPEEEIDFLADSDIAERLQQSILELEGLLKDAHQGQLLRDGIELAIIGRPNVGKSSLLNALAGDELAIVTDIPGTTRDVVRQQILIDGLPVHVADTAGLRETEDVIEAEGVRRALKLQQNADLVLLVMDASSDSQEELITIPDPQRTIVCWNKQDLGKTTLTVKTDNNLDQVFISTLEGTGLNELKHLISKHAGVNETTEGIFSARSRHLQALREAQALIKHGLQQLTEYTAPELLAEDLRQAQNCLGRITGEFSSDDLLGEIFSSFCIGK